MEEEQIGVVTALRARITSEEAFMCELTEEFVAMLCWLKGNSVVGMNHRLVSARESVAAVL